MITHVVQKWGSRLEEIHCGGVSSSSHTSCFIGWEVWCHWVAYPIKSHSATQKADQLRLTHRKQAALWDTTDNCQNLWKYPPASRKTSHHVPRTGLTACNLPGEVRSTKVFLLFSFFVGTVIIVVLLKKSVGLFFFNKFFIFAGQRSWKLCLEVYYKNQITASQAKKRKMTNWSKTYIQVLLLSMSVKLKWTTVVFRTFPNDVHLFSCRLNVDEPLRWEESFDKLLSSQSKCNPPGHSWCKCFHHSRFLEMTTRC